MKKAMFCLLAAALFPLSALAADSVYVQSAKARIMKEPNFKSAEVAVAKKGDKLQVVEKGDGWTKVSSGKESGWVNGLCISDSPPLEKVALVTDESADIGAKSRKRASAVTSAAASRGLTDAERKRLSEAGDMDYRSIMWAEKIAYSLTDKEIDAFTPQGGK